MTPEIARDELLTRMSASKFMVLIEALGVDYYEDAHLPGALNLQPDRVGELAPVLVPDLLTPIVVYCSGTCAAAAQTAMRLEALGYVDVLVYLGGKEDWVEAGLPVERTASIE